MKKKSIILLISLIVYCYLFYKQSAGINFTIFNVLLVSLLLLIDHTLIKSKMWISVAAGTLISSAGVLLYGNFLAVFGNIFSLVLLAHLSVDRNASLVFSMMQSVWSYIMMPFYAIEYVVEPKPETPGEKESSFSIGNLLKIAIPVLVVIVFFLIYKGSNPVFSKFIDDLHIKIEISWHFIGFLSLGFLLVYGFFYQKKFNDLTTIDQNASNMLSTGMEEKEFSLFSSLDKEFSAAIMTFTLLNTLLLLVNILDLNFIFSGKQATVSNYSQYVHQGINSSIFSVLVAIFVTLYFFRGNLNFIAKNKPVKYLALTWILLNAVLLATCFHKNTAYIAECGLTHKRIGVYIYLFLTFIGLVTTWIKITQLKSNMFLIRMNLWPIYLTLVFSTLYNWNLLILNHNATSKSEVEREYYLSNLSDASLPFLLENWKSLKSDHEYRESDPYFLQRLKCRTFWFIHQHKKADWQSWNAEDARIYKEIRALFKTKKFSYEQA